MSFHSNSLELRNYIQETYPELVDPIEEIQWANWESGSDLPDGKRIISIGFFLIGMYLSNIDGEVQSVEIDFLRDIKDLFAVEDYNISSEILLENYKSSIRDNPTLYRLQVPYAITFLNLYDKNHGTNYADKARTMYFRFANAFIKADSKVSPQEQQALLEIKQLIYPVNNSHSSEEKVSNSNLKSIKIDNEPTRSLDDLLEELNSLVGLQIVKNDVKQLVNFLKVQQIRISKGMSAVPISRHLVFYGNPGTGKTTVARLLAQIYKSLNIISKGHLVETDRSGLVAGYVGQTALKVQEVANRAIGGVLFIDEAYALTGDGQDFGREAIDTLLKIMEDNRDDLIVIVAGYTEKMSEFLLSNPGLKSRFNKYLLFDDYIPSQLISIFNVFCNNSGYKLTKEASEKILDVLQQMYNTKDQTFGNARLVRNIFEHTINNQANRIVTLIDIDEETLSTLDPSDVPDKVEICSL